MLKDHSYEWDEITIGGTLNAVTYALLHSNKILSVHGHALFVNDAFHSDFSLGLDFSYKKGSYKYEAHRDITFELALRGQHPFNSNLSAVRVDSDNRSINAITKDGSKIVIKYKKLRIFDTDSISGLPLSCQQEVDKYRVYDWFDVRSGMKHEHDSLEDSQSSFVKKIHFYISQRIDGNKTYKDLIAESELEKEELHNPDYSDSISRLKTINMMKEAGIRGTSNGGKQFLPIKLELYKREVIPVKRLEYKEVGDITIDNRTEKQVIDAWLSSNRNNTSCRATTRF